MTDPAAARAAARHVLRAPDELDPDQRALYDRIVGGPRKAQAGQVPMVDGSGALLGPFGLMTIAPRVGDAVQGVGAALRFAADLPEVVREAAILLVATARDCRFEWFAHEAAARAAGLDDEQLAALAAGRLPSRLEPVDAAALRVVAALLTAGTLDDAQYRVAVAELGERTLAELVWLVGYYSMLALALAVFDPPNPLDDGPARA